MIDLSKPLIRVAESGRIWDVQAGAYLGENDEPHPFVTDMETEDSLFAFLKSHGLPRPLSPDDYAKAIQSHLDATAQERGFDDADRCATYATDPIYTDFIAELPVIAWPISQ